MRLHTNLGDLNIELHCDMAPRTCENFLGLCEMGYYNDTIFHRSIKNFMIQVTPTLKLLSQGASPIYEWMNRVEAETVWCGGQTTYTLNQKTPAAGA